jgi:hypothetical protein
MFVAKRHSVIATRSSTLIGSRKWVTCLCMYGANSLHNRSKVDLVILKFSFHQLSPKESLITEFQKALLLGAVQTLLGKETSNESLK